MRRCHVLSRFLLGSKGIPYPSCIMFQARRSATLANEFSDEILSKAKPFEEMPSEMSLPLIGTAWIFLPVIGHYSIKEFSQGIVRRRKRLGDIFKDKFGPLTIVTSFSPDDLRTMYRHEGPYPMRSELESIKKYRELRKESYTTLGVSILNGKEWWDLRSKTQKHLMKPRAVLAFLDPMQEVARDFVRKIREVKDVNNEVPDFQGELHKWALESICLVGLDTRLGCLQTNLSPDSDGMKIIKSVQTMFDCIQLLEPSFGRLPIWKVIPTPAWKKFQRAGDDFAEIAFKHIRRSVEKMKTAQENDQELTLLQSMIMSKELDVSTAMVMASDMLAAGIDTTSNSVGFFLYHMAKNPEKQEQLYKALIEVLPQREDRITPAIFNELKYLKACIKESMRIDSIAPVHVRILDHDVIFSGYRVPAGTILFVVVQEIFKDEKYFPRAKEFLPERWLKKNEDFHPYSFVPFGFGVRSCIGRRIAELEMISLITHIIRNFRVEYHHEDIGKTVRLVSIPDKPLRFSFIER